MRPSDRWPEVEWLGIRDAVDARSFLVAVVLLVVLMAGLAHAPVWRLYAAAPQDARHLDRIRVMHRLATEFVRDAPDLLIVGGSQMRELFPADGFIAVDACTSPLTVFNAATSSQLPSASLALALHFDDAPPALTVIGVNPYRIHHPDRGGAEKAAFALPSAPLRVRIAVLRTDLNLMQDGQIFEPVTGGPFESAQHRYRGAPWDALRKAADAAHEVQLARAADRAAIEAHVDALVVTAQSLVDAGGRVLFVVPPHSPEADAAYGYYAPGMAHALPRLAEVGTVIDLRGDAALVSGDFFDAVHLLRAGRERLWPRLRGALVDALPGCRP